jgi:hypothetical protein
MPWLDPQSWDWASTAKTVIGAGVGTALVQGLLPLYRDWRHRKRQAAYMAMRLAVVLEAFASGCSAFIAGNQSAETYPDREYPDWNANLPELLPYPDDVDGWRATDRRLAGRCLNLRNNIHGSQTLIGWTIEFTEEMLGEVLDEHAATRGLEAWDLAVEKTEPVWNYAEALRETLQRVRERQAAAREARQAERERS